MELLLEVVSSERHMLGERASHRFLPAGGVIGRSSECDWTLPDQTRHLSGRHAIISYEAGQFFVTDISTNGVYLNGPDPLPRNVAVALNEDDRLLMGEFQMRVHILMEYSQSRPVPRPSHSQAHSRPPLGPGPQGSVPGAAANPMAQVDAFVADRQQQNAAAREPADWHRQSVSMPQELPPQQEPFSPPRPQVPTPPVQPLANGLPEDWMALSEAPDPMATVEAPAQSLARPEPQPARDSAAFAAFADGLGLTAREIEQAGGDAFLRRAGGLLRLCLQGMVANARARASLKNEFRLDMTLVNSRDNNPVKFSANVDQVLRHMLTDEQGSFLSVEEGVEECIDDFQEHQLAMMAGMQRAFMALIQQLSPDELERRFERLNTRGISMSSKGSRYWQAYRELHHELQEEDDIFAAMFAEPFAKAYDEQIAKLKHQGKKKKR